MQALLAAVAAIAIQLDQQGISGTSLAQIRAAMSDYRTWERVSDKANWAPTNCMIRPPTGVQTSVSTDPDTHGKKLYFLFARDSNAYAWIGYREATHSQPIGQTITKESWTHTKAAEPPHRTDPRAQGGVLKHEYPPEFALLDGQWCRTDKPAGLFIMAYVGEDKPNTDAGWIYATTNPSGDQFNSIGLIESCMGCHAKAPHGRLFGLPRTRR
ncbi:MAG: hypothetical protein ACKVS9_19310 [Phycisphaerae bacterium]